ncbi:MAG: NAD(P)H-hydrate epimerase [Endomicrobia bacterium]|nr:NAD(P)H-hydrate epimerase [Endomicrobiia bacterium]
MKKYYFTSEEIYKLDKLATEKFLIPSIILMENAGRLSAEFIRKYMIKNDLHNVIVFCGPGKNGGDGFVCARYLSIFGFKVVVVKFIPEKKYKGDTLINYKILKRLGITIQNFEQAKIKKLLSTSDVIIDAIFGIGLSRNVEGVFRDAIGLINNSKKVVFAIDIPSGINADTGDVLGLAVKADYTITMGALKKGFVKKTTKLFLGKVVVADIGYPRIDVSKL